jgi:mutator protein MutT
LNYTPTQVGIAVVEQDGHYLVGIRGAHQSLSGQAEFPGGKCRPGESSEVCAVRECLEETGLAVVPVRQLLETRFRYPHEFVELHFWLCRPAAPDSVTTTHEGYRWVPADHLPSQPFPAANCPVVRILCGSSSSERKSGNTDETGRTGPASFAF